MFLYIVQSLQIMKWAIIFNNMLLLSRDLDSKIRCVIGEWNINELL